MRMKILKIKVKGMTCASCEVILERGMKKVEGVKNVQVNRSKEKAIIHCENDVQLEDLQAAVADNGYTLIPHDTIDTPIRPPFIVKNKKRYSEIGSVIAILIGAYLIYGLIKLNVKCNICISVHLINSIVFPTEIISISELIFLSVSEKSKT